MNRKVRELSQSEMEVACTLHVQDAAYVDKGIPEANIARLLGDLLLESIGRRDIRPFDYRMPQAWEPTGTMVGQILYHRELPCESLGQLTRTA